MCPKLLMRIYRFWSSWFNVDCLLFYLSKIRLFNFFKIISFDFEEIWPLRDHWTRADGAQIIEKWLLFVKSFITLRKFELNILIHNVLFKCVFEILRCRSIKNLSESGTFSWLNVKFLIFYFAHLSLRVQYIFVIRLKIIEAGGARSLTLNENVFSRQNHFIICKEIIIE